MPSIIITELPEVYIRDPALHLAGLYHSDVGNSHEPVPGAMLAWFAGFRADNILLCHGSLPINGSVLPAEIINILFLVRGIIRFFQADYFTAAGWVIVSDPRIAGIAAGMFTDDLFSAPAAAAFLLRDLPAAVVADIHPCCHTYVLALLANKPIGNGTYK
jgi:hypothetical protein